jgi:hypothetical protein
MMNIDVDGTPISPGKISTPHAPSAYSLNRAARIKELVRVTSENRKFLQKL